MKASIIYYLMISFFLITNDITANTHVGSGEKMMVKAKSIYLFDVSSGYEYIHQLFVAIDASHLMDSVQAWFVDKPAHSTIRRLQKTNPQSLRIVMAEKLQSPYEYNPQTSSGVGCKWTFWFVNTNAQSFTAENEAEQFSMKRFLELFDIEEINKISKALGNTDTLTPGDTSNYMMAEVVDSIEITIPTDSTADSVVCYLDSDGDGSGDPNNSQVFQDTTACPTGYVDNNQDCDDGDPNINNAAMEVCDSIDNNCDGMIDNGCMPPMREGIFSQQDPIIVGESPNPFKDRVTINYSILENNTKIKMQVFDVAGRLVTDLVKETQSLGDYQVEWEPESKVPFGIYYLKVNIISSEGEVQIINKKLIYNR